jgi:hypothetical protein
VRGNLIEKGEIASLPAGRQGFTRNDNFSNVDFDEVQLLTPYG